MCPYDMDASTKTNRSITPEWKKLRKSKIELGLPFMVHYLEYKFQMRGTL